MKEGNYKGDTVIKLKKDQTVKEGDYKGDKVIKLKEPPQGAPAGATGTPQKKK